MIMYVGCHHTQEKLASFILDPYPYEKPTISYIYTHNRFWRFGEGVVTLLRPMCVFF